MELQRYAARGVFSGLGQSTTRRGEELRFLWHAPFHHRLLVASPSSLVLVDLLPNAAFRSPLDRQIRRFLVERQSPDLPHHRAFPTERLALAARNRNSAISIEVTSHDGDLSFAARKSVALINEIFHGFLTGPWESYMVETFGVPEE